MLQFPIEWKIPIANTLVSKIGNVTSKLVLNEDWGVALVGNTVRTRTIDDSFLKITRRSACNEMLLSGTLLILLDEVVIFSHEFVKLMEPGYYSAQVNLKKSYSPQKRPARFVPYSARSFYEIRGTIYVTTTKGNTSKDLPVDECKISQSLVTLSKDFERLLDPQTSSFADFNLKCGDVIIPTHKNILSARSPVFAAMFAHEMKENRENMVDITDMDECVVRAMLTFMYTGQAALTVALASDLLSAANKYQVDDLKIVCCDFLKKSITPINMLHVYVLGDLHNEDLKAFAQNCICNTYSDFAAFEKTEKWKYFKEEKPNLALDLAIAMVKSKERQLKVHQGS